MEMAMAAPTLETQTESTTDIPTLEAIMVSIARLETL